jgi:selenocysteine-specific elongation factor
LADFLRGTFLEGAPILPISNVTGAGFDAFLESLAQLVNSIEPKRIDGVFRLPIERAFSVQGYGTVVAGIPVAGAAHAGDEVLLLPAGLEGRIKRIEVYGRAGDTVMAGQCAALNVGHWDHRAIRRGDVLTQPGYFTPREWHAATVRLLPRPKLNVKNGAEVRFHTGTSETNAAVYAVEGQRLQGGSECLIQIRTKAPIVAGPGDHFILRKLSPVETIGGGVLIEASEERLKRNRPEVIEDLRARAKAIGEPKRFVEYAVRRAQRLAASPAELASRTKVPHERLQAILADLLREERILSLPGGLYAHRDTAAEVGQRILALVADFHRQTPESPGIAWEQLRQSAACDKAVLDGLIAVLAAQNRLVVKNDRLALPEHRAAFSDEQAGQAAQIEELFRTGAFHPPGVEEVAQRTGLARGRLEKILRTLCEQGRLVPVEELWFHREAVEKAQNILVALLEKEGRLESVRFKYLLDTARIFAIPLLDHFDRIGVTRRSGNTRYLKRPAGGK